MSYVLHLVPTLCVGTSRLSLCSGAGAERPGCIPTRSVGTRNADGAPLFLQDKTQK